MAHVLDQVDPAVHQVAIVPTVSQVNPTMNQLDLAVNHSFDQVDPVAVDVAVEELDHAVDLTNPAVALQRSSVALCSVCW